jgi:hypothetical protein
MPLDARDLNDRNISAVGEIGLVLAAERRDADIGAVELASLRTPFRPEWR